MLSIKITSFFACLLCLLQCRQVTASAIKPALLNRLSINDYSPMMYRRNEATKVYFGNLSRGVNRGSLHNFASSYGKVLDEVVMQGGSGGCAFGFVTFSTAEEASHAIASLNNAAFYGQRIVVAKANGPRARC